MSIFQKIILRHRSAGYVRFDLPESLCENERASRIEWALQQHPAIISVRLYAHSGKLAIRYFEGAANLRVIAALLKDVVLDANAIEVASSSCCATSSQTTELIHNSGRKLESGFSAWIREKTLEIRETITAFGIVLSTAFGFNSQKNIFKNADLSDFLTDILVLYLIRLHWHAITQFWLKRPWLYRYEWMATVYMIFLLVRSRQSKAQIS